MGLKVDYPFRSIETLISRRGAGPAGGAGLFVWNEGLRSQTHPHLPHLQHQQPRPPLLLGRGEERQRKEERKGERRERKEETREEERRGKGKEEIRRKEKGRQRREGRRGDVRDLGLR